MFAFVSGSTATAPPAVSELQFAELLILLKKQLDSRSWPTLQEALGTKMLQWLTQNICCKCGSALSPGPLKAPPAHDN